MMNEYLTVKEFAAAAGISQQAVYKQIGSRLKPYVVNKGNQKVIAEEALKTFYPDADSIRNSTLDSTNSTLDSTNSTGENPEIQPDSMQKEDEVEQVKQPDSTGSGEDSKQKDLEEQIKKLQEQIENILKNEQEEKEFLKEQIRQKDKQIDSLTENLAMAQQLAAADKRKLLELEEKQKEEPMVVEDLDIDPEPPAADQEIEEPKKKGFWASVIEFFS